MKQFWYMITFYIPIVLIIRAYLSGRVAGDHRKGPGFESSAGDLSSEVVDSLNYTATNLSDLSD